MFMRQSLTGSHVPKMKRIVQRDGFRRLGRVGILTSGDKATGANQVPAR